jgi:hypothetical protein
MKKSYAENDWNIAALWNDKIASKPQDGQERGDGYPASDGGGPQRWDALHNDLGDRPVQAPRKHHDCKQNGRSTR